MTQPPRGDWSEGEASPVKEIPDLWRSSKRMDDFGRVAFGIIGDGMDEDLVHEAFEAVVFAVAEEFGTVVGILYLQRVPA